MELKKLTAEDLKKSPTWIEALAELKETAEQHLQRIRGKEAETKKEANHIYPELAKDIIFILESVGLTAKEVKKINHQIYLHLKGEKNG